MTNTRLRYGWNNGVYRREGDAIVAGAPTKELGRRILRACDDFGGSPQFLPPQVAIAELLAYQYVPGSDHQWHTFDGLEPTEEAVTEARTVEELALAFEQAARDGWREVPVEEMVRRTAHLPG